MWGREPGEPRHGAEPRPPSDGFEVASEALRGCRCPAGSGHAVGRQQGAGQRLPVNPTHRAQRLRAGPAELPSQRLLRGRPCPAWISCSCGSHPDTHRFSSVAFFWGVWFKIQPPPHPCSSIMNWLCFDARVQVQLSLRASATLRLWPGMAVPGPS